MKKTLVAILALSGMAMALQSETIHITTTAPAGDQANNINGFTLSMTNPEGYNMVTVPSELTETVTLNSVALKGRNGGAAFGANAKMAIYVFEGDNKTGTFVGLSTNVCTSVTNGAYATFTFDDLAISSTDRYQFLLVNADSTADSIATFDGYKEHAVQWGMALTADKAGDGANPGTKNLPGGYGVYTSSGINAWWSHRLVGVDFSVSNIVDTPEPATATLSLLALAGLAARRRRH